MTGAEVRPDPRRVIVALLLVYLLFGSGFLGTRLVMRDVGPVQAMGQRFFIAAVVLLLVVLATSGATSLRLTRRQAITLVLTGVLLLGFGNAFAALAQVSGLASGVAALIIAMVPVWTALLRALVGDVPSGLTVVGIATGVLGLVVFVVLGRGVDGTITAAGLLFAVGAGLAWALGSFTQGRRELPEGTFVVAMYQSFVAAAASLVISMIAGERLSMDYSPHGWMALGLLVVISVVGFSAFAWLVANTPLSVVATHAYVNPVVAVLLGWALLDERITAPILVGGAVILVGVVVILVGEARSGRRARAMATSGLVADQ